MRIVPGLAALACAALASALPALAWQEAPEAPSVFGDEIEVRVINVEVVVTDGKGNRTPDLKPGDFRLRVDGKPVPIEYFTEVREGQAVAAPAAPNALDAPEPVVAGLPAVEPGAPVGTNYLVFVDDYFLIARQRDDVLQSLKRDLSGLRPEDRMSVIAWDGGRLSRLAGWTSSREEIAGALEQAMKRPTRGLDRAADYRSFLLDDEFIKSASSDPEFADGGADEILTRLASPGLSMKQRAYGEGLSRQLGSAVSAVVSAMRGSGEPAGRKVLLLLSGGWPFSVLSYLGAGEPTLSLEEMPTGEQLFGPLTRTANLLGYTVYPIDVPGLTSVAADATVNPMEGRGSVIMGLPGTSDRPNAELRAKSLGAQKPMPAMLTDFKNLIEQELQGSLEFIAKETGGKPILNSNRTLALARASADTRSYYWLGFSPSWRRDDKSHKIKVEALRPGLEVRARNDFLDLSRQAEVAMKIESALLFGGLPGDEHLAMRLGAPASRKGKGVEIPITLGIPVSAMTVLPVDGKYVAELELRFAATDDRGNQSDIPAVPLKLSSSQAPAEGKYVRYETKLVLHGKARRIVAAIYDRASGKIAAAEADLAAN
jgi:VWFA-related protein